MTPADRSRAICAGLAAAVMVSAVAAVYAKHKSRKLFVELQTLTAERDRLEMDWGRLQIEQQVDDAGRPVGLLARADIIRALKERGPDARVADAMSKEFPIIGHRQRLDDALRLLQEKAAPAVAIVDAGGRLVGLVTSETIGEMMMLRQALPKGATLGPWGPAPRT